MRTAFGKDAKYDASYIKKDPREHNARKTIKRVRYSRVRNKPSLNRVLHGSDDKESQPRRI